MYLIYRRFKEFVLMGQIFCSNSKIFFFCFDFIDLKINDASREKKKIRPIIGWLVDNLQETYQPTLNVSK